MIKYIYYYYNGYRSSRLVSKKKCLWTYKNSDFLFKYLIIGNSGCGKSSLLIRFVDDTFSDNYVSTIGVDFKLKTIELDGKTIKLQIWDTAGQERFKNIISSYYRGAQGVIFVYDITDLETFQALDTWQIEVEKNSPKDVYKILVGNKSDMENDRRVTVNQGKEYAEQNGMKFFETSAKDSKNVSDIFLHLTQVILKKNNVAPLNTPETPNQNQKQKSKPTVIKEKDSNIPTKKPCCPWFSNSYGIINLF